MEGNLEAVLAHLRHPIDDPAFGNPIRTASAIALRRGRAADRLLTMRARVRDMAEPIESFSRDARIGLTEP